MNEKVREFLELIENNPELKSKVEVINNTPGATAADFIALAKEYGMEITQQDFRTERPTSELTGDELEAVTGGWGGKKPGEGHVFWPCVGLGCSWGGRL